MLIDDLRQQLKDREADIHTIKTFWTNAKIEPELEQLSAIENQEDFWQHPDNITISKRLSAIKQQREAYQNVISGYEETLELLDLFEADEAELKKMASDITQLCRNISKFKIELLLKNPEDKNACFMSINAGAGGTESQDWANMLLRMYTRFCERERLKTDIIDYQAGEEAGIKSATLYVTGKNAYGLLKTENGVHRLVRISPFDSNKRRHTSFSSVSVTPELQEVELAPIEQKDLRIDTYRASGAGGQHINKTESAVRITHIPTNIVVQCQNQRSQIQNRETAMKMLRAKLAHKQREKEEAKAQKGTAEKKKIEWGSQIRSYVLHPYKMVKDHRTSHESSQPDLVLDGDLIDFIEQYLVQ